MDAWRSCRIVFSALDTTRVSSAAIIEPTPVRASTQRRAVRAAVGSRSGFIVISSWGFGVVCNETPATARAER
jgi:hypothetical protein